MSGVFSVTVQEARGFVAVPADLDRLAIVLGNSSVGTGLSPFFDSGAAAVTALGYGDGVDVLTQIIEQRQADGSAGTKFPAAMFSMSNTTAGSYGTIDVTGVTGASVVTVDATSHPFGTYEAQLRVTNGGTVGVAGITLVWSLDHGRNESIAVALGTATTFTIPNSNVKFNFTSASLNTGDIVRVRTKAPAPAAADIDAAATAILAASIDFRLLVCAFPMTSALAAHVTTMLNGLAAQGKKVTALVRTRIPDAETSETEATWFAAVASDFSTFTDSRIEGVATYGLLTDAMTTRQYLRSDLAQWAADVVRIGRAKIPDVPADRPEANFILVDSTGVTVGHDEGVRGATTGLSNDTLGNRFRCNMRLPDPQRREEVFTTVPWVFYASDERIRTLPVRRLMNAVEATAVSAGTAALGGNFFYVPGPPATLTAASRAGLHGSILAALQAEFPTEIANINDGDLETGLVQVSPSVTVAPGGLLIVGITIAPRVAGFLLTINFTLAVQS